jgi:hypothetical protein
MTEEGKDTFVEETNNKQAEYERRRAVWRYTHNLPGPQLPPCEADAHWLNGGAPAPAPAPAPTGRVVTEGEW